MISIARNFWAATGAALLAIVLAFGSGSAGPAAAAPLGQAGTGTVSGQVLSADNVPLAGVRLAAFNQAPGTANRTPLAEFQSDAQGQYSVQVPAGTVWVEFLTQDIRGQSFWGYSNLPVNVAEGQTAGGQDFRVAIRVVSEPSPPVTVPAPVTPPGMPSTGGGFDPGLAVAGVLGLLLVALGLVTRRRAAL
jgi:LPXTG-motif cell wall-anchored protein